MSNRALEFLIWGVGVIIFLLAIPFFPRQDVRTPIRAVGMAIGLGLIWPLLLLISLVHYVPWWYWLKWVEYREFLIETKMAWLEQEFKSQWDIEAQKKFPEAYLRQKESLESYLSTLNIKAGKLTFRRRLLESKLLN